VAAAIQRAVETKAMFELEHRVRRTDGTLGWTISRAKLCEPKTPEIRLRRQ
jgi:hypothetical protein